MQTSTRPPRERSRWSKSAKPSLRISKEPPHPRIVSREEWTVSRRWHLAEEKRVTKEHDTLTAERRQLPMVRLEKEYVFAGPHGKQSLRDLFAGRHQLIVYHFMFDPRWRRGCPGCTGYVDALGDLSLLTKRDTSFAVISRAPFEKLKPYREKRGWDIHWLSSYGSDFNYDFHVTLDEKVAPVEYNYRSQAQLELRDGPHITEGEAHGLSVFFRIGKDVYHTYSAYGRGVEGLTNAYSLLDTTPYGRQEDWEESPTGWPQKPTYAAEAKDGYVARNEPEGGLDNVIRYSPDWASSDH